MKASQLYELLERQGFRCALSGQLLEPSTASIDHIRPISGGGEHEIGNLQWVTNNINRAKGRMSNDEFINMCLMVAERYRQSKSEAA